MPSSTHLSSLSPFSRAEEISCPETDTRSTPPHDSHQELSLPLTQPLSTDEEKTMMAMICTLFGGRDFTSRGGSDDSDVNSIDANEESENESMETCVDSHAEDGDDRYGKRQRLNGWLPGGGESLLETRHGIFNEDEIEANAADDDHVENSEIDNDMNNNDSKRIYKKSYSVLRRRNFLSFTDARERVRKLNFKSRTEWSEWSKLKHRPMNIPSTPHFFLYRQGWKDWLGSRTISAKRLGFLNFTVARDIVRQLNIKSRREWREWSISEHRPMNFPTNPYQVYGQEWLGYRDWLGISVSSREIHVYQSFTDARNKVRKLNLKSVKEWQKWSKSEHRPKNIPSAPAKVYRSVWQGYSDWLGTGIIANINQSFLCFTEAHTIVSALNLKSLKLWRKWSKSKQRPNNIPSNPDQVYGQEWQGYGDWLGARTNANLVFLSFTDARDKVRSLNLKGLTEWRNWSKSEDRPKNIPSFPNEVYKREWRGYKDWLCTGTISTKNHDFLSFSDSREIVRLLNLKSQREWQKWSKSELRPENIPSTPGKIYRREWQGYRDWLGTTSISTKGRNFLSMSNARDIVRSLNLKSQREWWRWTGVPATPHIVYGQEWLGWRDWLGSGTV